MNARMIVLLSVTAMTVSAFGQTTRPVDGAKTPYVGVVKGTILFSVLLLSPGT